MKKIGIVKLGARISFNASDTSGGNGEARSIVNVLQKSGLEVHIFTKILKKDDLLSQFKWHNIMSDNERNTDGLDALVVINGSVNFFGGAEDPFQILNYEIINKFKGPVFYFYCDPALLFKEVTPLMVGRSWESNWNLNSLKVPSDIHFICQSKNLEHLKHVLSKKNVIQPCTLAHFPFDKFPCLNECVPLENLKEPKFDLSYGGTMRGGRRINKMIKYYFGAPENISVEMFGKIELKDFPSDKVGDLRPPSFGEPVTYNEIIPKMTESMAHMIIGDPLYETLDHGAQRTYEALWAGNVIFIDPDLDKNRNTWHFDDEDFQQYLNTYFYPNDRDELYSRIQEIKTYNLRRDFVAAQREAVKWNEQEYCDQLRSLIEQKI